MFRRLSILLALAAAPAVAGPVVLNEFMAVNTNVLQDEDGEFSDWIEIYNGGTATVNLAGWRLTDNSNNLAKWTFPATNIAPGGFVLVFASEKNRATSGAELHTNFKLDGGGEYLALVEPGGAIATEYAPTFPLQAANVSYGLAPGSITNLLLETNANCRVFVPPNDNLGFDWTERFFDDSAWVTGRVGVGYGNAFLGYPNDTRTDVQALMFNINPTIYIRVPFVVPDASRIESLDLQMKFDDGFVAYLNGNEVASANDHDDITWNSAASALNDATNFVSFPIGDAREYLETGTNVLAIHGLNRTANSSDLLMLPRLFGIEAAAPDNGLMRYFSIPTPRAPNTAGAAQLGPSLLDVGHDPARPMPGEDLVVRARIVPGLAGLATASLHYIIMFTNTVTVPLMPESGDVYAGAVPGGSFSTGQMIRYAVSAVGTNGVTNRWPLAEDTIQWLGTVAQNPSVTTALRTFEWFVQMTNWYARTNGTGNNLNATNVWVFFDGRFYDGATARVRGNSSQNWRKPHFKFEFSKGHYFTWDPAEEPVEEFNLQSTYSDKAYIRQILGMETYRDAGTPYSAVFPVQVRQNGHFYSVAVWLEQPGEKYLRRNGRDPEGALYKMFNTMTSSSSGVEKKTRKSEPNTDLQALVNGVTTSATAAARERYLFDNVDLPKALTYIAATTIMHDTDHIAKNYYAYRDTLGDREWTYLPWDKDLTFGRNYTTNNGGVLNDTIWADKDVLPAPTNRSPSHPLYGDSDHQKSDSGFNRLIDAIHDTPIIRQMYLRRLRTLMDELLQTNGTPAAQLKFENRIAELRDAIAPDVELDRIRWGNPYGSNQTLDVAIALLTNQYLNVRRTHLYVTHSGPAGTNGAGIPLAQTVSPTLHFGTIEFAPATSNQAQEYIEIRNTNAVAVDLSGWSVSNAVRFTFEPGCIVAARSNFYLSPDPVAFRARPTSPRSNESRLVYGPYGGSLSARGETIELYDRSGTLIQSTTYTGAPSAFLNYLRITEIMYHPDSSGDAEFIELKNIGPSPMNLAGVKFTSGINFTFTNFTLAPGALTVVVRSFAAFTNVYDPNGISIAGVYSAALNNSGDRIVLRDPLNEEILDFRYEDYWHPTTDGEGASLQIVNPLASFDTWGQSNAWRPSRVFRGTPGREEPTLAPGTVVINEALTHSDTNQDWVELWNCSTNPVDISGWLLSDSGGQLAKYVFPAGSILTAGAYRVFTENDFNNPTNPACLVPFAFSELGEETHLCEASGGVPGAYHETVVFGAAERFVTFGRHVTSDGRVLFVAMSEPTPGSNNAPPKVGPLIISEIMYHPSGSAPEFIEILNLSNAVVTLYDPARPTNRWKLTSAVEYTFPTNRSLPAGGYAIVSGMDPSQFRSLYGVPTQVPVFGPFTGKLDNAGESVRLRKPTDPETNGVAPYVLVEQVDYRPSAPWPTNASGTGFSIERLTNNAFANDPIVWAALNRQGSPGTLPQLDANDDGLPDNWQMLHFLTTNAVGSGDWDFDGVPNADEYLYGSQPTNSSHNAKITLTNDGSQFYLKFPTYEAKGPGYFGLNRYYAVDTAPSVTGPWSAAGLWLGQNGTNTYVEPATNASWFYRVRAWLQDAAP